jgi:transposase
VIRNFNADGFTSLYPRYKGGRPPKFTLPQRREIKKMAKSRRGCAASLAGLASSSSGRITGCPGSTA